PHSIGFGPEFVKPGVVLALYKQAISQKINLLSMSEISKAYEPASVEKKWYSSWLKDGCFTPDLQSNRPGYSIVIPPPNVTGVLTLGHVLNNTLQDVLA